MTAAFLSVTGLAAAAAPVAPASADAVRTAARPRAVSFSSRMIEVSFSDRVQYGIARANSSRTGFLINVACDA